MSLVVGNAENGHVETRYVHIPLILNDNEGDGDINHYYQLQ